MVDKNFIAKLADIPLARPGFDAFSMSAPALIQMNPYGKWESCKPDNLNEERMRSVIQHLVNSKTLGAAQNYCYQCAEQSQKDGCGTSNYVPVIMMPLLPFENCPFDMECNVREIQEADSTPPNKANLKQQDTALENDKEKKKTKKRGFVLQRLTDFDLLSQW